MINAMKRFFIAKPHFTVAGASFDTREALEGFFESLRNNRRGVTPYVVVDGAFPTFAFGFPSLSEVPACHSDLHARFKALLSSTSLSTVPRLGVTQYNPLHGAATEDVVYMDTSALRILNPAEAENILAHELAHIELGHTAQIANKRGLTVKRAWEFAADARAAEITRNPEALISGLTKLEAYGAEMRAASPILERLHAFSKGVMSLGATLRGKSIDGIHPSLAERVEKLSGFAERLAKEAERGHIHLP